MLDSITDVNLTKIFTLCSCKIIIKVPGKHYSWVLVKVSQCEILPEYGIKKLRV